MKAIANIANCRAAVRAGLFAGLLLPSLAAAEPIELKLSFFGSEQTDTFRYGVKPFVDAVNAEGQGVVGIKVYPDSKLGSLAEQSQMVLDGKADIAVVIPGQTPYRFPDNQMLEMPGLFRDVREGTLVYTRLVEDKALRGYDPFFVIGAYTSAPSIIHSRRPIESLADLKDRRIRTNNPMEAEAVSRFGAIPTVMPVSMLADALKRGTVDAAIISPTGFFQFGAAVAKNHYLLSIGSAPLLVLMSRARFDALPPPVQAIIRNHSGEHAAAIWVDLFGKSEQQSLDRIKSDPERTAVEPSAADLKTAQAVYRSLIDAWAAKDARNAALTTRIGKELTAIRSAR